MSPDDIRKLADVIDKYTMPEEVRSAHILRALANLMDAVLNDAGTSESVQEINEALDRVEAIKP